MAAENPHLELDPKYDHYPNKHSGHLGHTMPEQDAQVFQLRMMLEAAGYKERLDTLTLLRFLRARKFDVALSLKMFEDCERWRKEFNLDELVRTFEYTEKPEVFQYHRQYYHKTDKDGRPVYIEQLGNIDLTAMYKVTTSDRMLQNLAVEYEKPADLRLPACSRKSGSLLETCCSIIDLKGVGVTKGPSVFSYVKLASAMSQNYYPERLSRLYLINTPFSFSTVFSVIKGWLDPITIDKIHFLGANYHKDLLDHIPAENLPEIFGGSCKCEGGCEFSDSGPWRDPEWAKPTHWELDAEKVKKESANGGTAPVIETIPVHDAVADEIKAAVPVPQ